MDKRTRFLFRSAFFLSVASVVMLSIGIWGINQTRQFGTFQEISGTGGIVLSRKALSDYRVPNNPYALLAVNLAEQFEYDSALNAISKVNDPIDKLMTMALCLEYCLPRGYVPIIQEPGQPAAQPTFSGKFKLPKLEKENDKFLLELCMKSEETQNAILKDRNLLESWAKNYQGRLRLSNAVKATMVMIVPSESDLISRGSVLVDNFAKIYGEHIAIEKQIDDKQRKEVEFDDRWRSIYQILLAMGTLVGLAAIKVFDPLIKAFSEVASRRVALEMPKSWKGSDQIRKELDKNSEKTKSDSDDV
jgi:hypothetical protein